MHTRNEPMGGHRGALLKNGYLGVLILGDVDEDLGGGVDDVEEAHDGGAVVGDGGALAVVDELVHPAGAQRGVQHVRHRHARADVAQHLPAALRRVRALLEQDDLRLLRKARTPGKRVRTINLSTPSLLACLLARERGGDGAAGVDRGFARTVLTIIPDMAGGCAEAELGFGVR